MKKMSIEEKMIILAEALEEDANVVEASNPPSEGVAAIVGTLHTVSARIRMIFEGGK